MAGTGVAGQLVVSRERHHEFQPVGMVFYKDSSLVFSYHDDYLATADAAEISLSLSLDRQDVQPAGFFRRPIAGGRDEGAVRQLYACERPRLRKHARAPEQRINRSARFEPRRRTSMLAK